MNRARDMRSWPALCALALTATGCGSPPVELVEGIWEVVQTEVSDGCDLPAFPTDDGTGLVEVEARPRWLIIHWEPSGFANVVWPFPWEEDGSFELLGLEELRKVVPGCTADVGYKYSGRAISETEITVNEVIFLTNALGVCDSVCEASFDYVLAPVAQ